jgi:hypothetical protein
MQVHVGQNRREAVGVFHLDLVVAEARPQPIVRVACLDRAGKQPRGVDARQLADVAGVVQHLDPAGLRQEHAHHRLAALAVPAEVIKRIVMAAFDNRGPAVECS